MHTSEGSNGILKAEHAERSDAGSTHGMLFELEGRQVEAQLVADEGQSHCQGRHQESWDELERLHGRLMVLSSPALLHFAYFGADKGSNLLDRHLVNSLNQHHGQVLSPVDVHQAADVD